MQHDIQKGALHAHYRLTTLPFTRSMNHDVSAPLAVSSLALPGPSSRDRFSSLRRSNARRSHKHFIRTDCIVLAQQNGAAPRVWDLLSEWAKAVWDSNTTVRFEQKCKEVEMHIWRDIGPELSVGLYLVAWVATLLVTHFLSR